MADEVEEMAAHGNSSSSKVRVAVVTGAGRGIGRMAAMALAADAGFSLVLAGRQEAPLERTVSDIVAAGGKAWHAVTDVTDEGSVERLFASVANRHGRLDLLFNNAGIGMRSKPVGEIEKREWDKVVATNLTGTFLCTRAAFQLMRQNDPSGGRIINNGSISAHVPRPYSAAYTATKHAITGLTRSTSLDGRRFAIACGQIDVGNAATELTEEMDAGVPQADGTVRKEPRMDARDVARAVVFMASLPLEANVQFITVMATQMPFIGRG